MDIAIKQRILGGVVLLAGAVLFLPMLLEGSGVKALQPPELPAAPATPSTADLAPPLQQKAQELEAGVAASHGDPTFYDVQPPQGASEAAPTPAVPEQFHVVSPPTAKPAAPAPEPVKAPVAAAADKSADKAAEKAAEKQAAAKAQADKLAADKAAAAKTAAAKLASDKAAAEKAAAGKTAQAQADKLAAEKAAKVAADKAAQQKAAAKAVAMQDPDPALPQAWVVQAGNFAARDKAQALVDKLRGKGFRASLAGKDGTWRVIIGPELDKSLAESAKKRLAADADLKLSGWIQAYRP